MLCSTSWRPEGHDIRPAGACSSARERRNSFCTIIYLEKATLGKRCSTFRPVPFAYYIPEKRDDYVFEAEYSIPYAGIGPDGAMKLPVLLDILQDMADRDAHRMSMTVADLLPRGLSWVLRQYRVVVDRYPGHESMLKVRTWHGPRRNLHSIRAFEVRDAAGPVASAWTSWILIDTLRGRPLRLDRHTTEVYTREAYPMDGDAPSLPVVEDFAYDTFFSVRRWDLDRNAHVNNAVYFSWAVESAPDAVAAEYELVKVEAEYLKPVEKNGDVRVRTALLPVDQGEKAFFHLIEGPDGEVKAHFATRWRGRK